MQLSAIREDCVGSLAELAQCLGTQAPAPPTALVSAPPEKWCGALKNAILTADEYAAITSRLQVRFIYILSVVRDFIVTANRTCMFLDVCFAVMGTS